MQRRDFIVTSGLVSLGFLGLQRCTVGGSKFVEETGYGSLLPDPEGVINLPKGFTYKIISKKGTPMSDGFLLPGAADGMATFNIDNKVVIIRNHELSPGNLENGPFGMDENNLPTGATRDLIYDFGSGKSVGVGGTTTVVFDEKTQTVEKEYLSLVGTVRNCAGGPTPWNSWISCEESTLKADGTLEKDHGYNFEVKATTQAGIQAPIPLKAMGRFNHEAVAVDPKTGIVYLTEDAGDGLIYRFIPEKYGDLSRGKLQAMKLKDRPSFDSRNWQEESKDEMPLNEQLAVEWMDLEDIESPNNDLRLKGYDAGAIRFARGEGMWNGKGEFYFACTNGGQKKNGQIFRYIPSSEEGTATESKNPAKLELFVESQDAQMLEHADNLTYSPWGDLIVCEDKREPKLVGVTPKGELYHFAENVGFKSEFAGACFSPSGETLFVNIQGPGLTLAIQGPWKSLQA
ncbi:MAG: alkaline phosphatase PhoX [Bacteroidota bacterium]